MVAFAFILFNAPWYMYQFVYMIKDPYESSNSFAGYLTYRLVAAYLTLTNHGINVFLYSVSGQKFRKDVKRLFSPETVTVNVASI